MCLAKHLEERTTIGGICKDRDNHGPGNGLSNAVVFTSAIHERHVRHDAGPSLRHPARPWR